MPVIPAIYGTNGNDFINAPGQAIYGLGGDDELRNGIIMDGGDGNDLIFDGAGDSTIFGGAGNDIVFDFYGTDVVDMGAGDDRFYFDPYHVYATDNDTVMMGSGNDFSLLSLVYNGSGDARTLSGGDGIDTVAILGNSPLLPWFDVLDFRTLSNAGTMTIGNFFLSSFEQVYLSNSVNASTIIFGDYSDHYEGGTAHPGVTNPGPTVVYGNGGADVLITQYLGGTMFGGTGNDVLVSDGGSGKPNKLYGDEGNDLLFSGFQLADYDSSAWLTGGAGSDGFIIANAGYPDVIMDFDVSQDWIGIRPSDAKAALDLEVTQKLVCQKFNVIDNAMTLSFDMFNPQASRHTQVMHVTYDRVTGRLTLQAGTSEYVIQINGAPQLTTDHFFTMTAQFALLELGLVPPIADTLHGNHEANALSLYMVC